MVGKKQTKRTRKFVAQGGVKARLQKGTITNNGSLKRKHGNKKQNTDDNGNKRSKADFVSSQYMDERLKKREDADFASEKNLGDLDVESFFETFGKSEETEDILNEEGGMESSGDDEDSEGNENENEEDSPFKLREKQSTKMSANEKDTSPREESDDDDISEAERQMKEEMKKLQQNDPDFHQFLKENEDSLLGYGEEEENDEDPLPQKRSRKGKGEDESEVGSETMLTASLLAKLENGAFTSHGIKPLRKVVNAFRSACHLTDDNDEPNTKEKLYSIESSDVFDRLMVITLTKCHDEFRYHFLPKQDGDEGSAKIDFDPNKPINPKLMEKAERWPTAKPIMFAFFKSTIHLLSEAKEPDLLVFVLKTLLNYVPFLTPFPRLAESLLKVLTALWSAPIDASEDYQVVRLHSFLRMRQLALTQPFPFIEDCLKKSYLAYAQRAKFATSSSATSALPTLTFMGNCIVELYSLDYHSSYQHAFVYIRQLALHLRAAMQKKTTEAVYCWQYLHCLKLWVAVITEACQSSCEDDGERLPSIGGEDQLLRSLIFPLTQVILGLARLVPSARYLPLRLHCVRLLQQIAAAGQIFLPTTSILLDAFDLPELSQPPKKMNSSNVQPIRLTLRLRADNPLRSMEELEMCISEVFVLLNREIDLYQYSAGFPEFAVRISQRLKKFSKETRQARWRTYAKGCLEQCQKFSTWAMNQRINPNNKQIGDTCPKDIKQLEILRPLSAPSMGQRHKESLEKEKRLEMAARPIQQKTSNGKKADEETVETDSSFKGNGKQKKNKKKSTDGTSTSNSASLDASTGGVDQEDMVEELNWSDEE
ncbi:Noc2p family protein [Nitzschia inconspicua]|uniref:Noc2p family protein n=1 Tax=Nitzschia inconspicua TaxID=303405 RepID=A0A9K3L7E3_9STRA|nr:Noc2p family protein [Nitzschia inconspicua]